MEADGILTAAGKAKWRPETLKEILQNEKYIDDALLQKTYTVDFLNKKRVKNNGIVPQYYVENSHEPIIPRDLYMRVQEADLRAAVIRAINLTLGDRSGMLEILEKNVEAVIMKEDVSSADSINARLEELQKELLKLANARKDYGGIADEIDRLRELKQKALAERAEREGLKKRIAEMRKFLREQDTKVTEYDEQLVRRLIVRTVRMAVLSPGFLFAQARIWRLAADAACGNISTASKGGELSYLLFL